MEINKKIVNDFVEYMENIGEFVFGDYKQIKQQLEMTLNYQGYWSGVYYRIYYDKDKKIFYAVSKY